jgi:hypothetical protein
MFLFLMAAAVSIALLSWSLFRRFTTDHLQKLNDGRRAGSVLVGRGEFVDGNRRLDMALALTNTALYYENASFHASLDLEWIEEVDYDTQLATGRTVTGGTVMRLRCDRQVFEFVVPDDAVTAWKTAFPARRKAEALAPVAIAGEFA